MNMFKKNGGFTLVELIVVIAILAILAGVAVPVYSGYISKANEAADLTQLDSIKTAAAFAVMEDNPYAVVKTIKVTSAGQVTVTTEFPTGTATANQTPVPSVSQADIEALAGPAYTFKSNNSEANWSNSGDNANKWVFTPATSGNNG